MDSLVGSDLIAVESGAGAASGVETDFLSEAMEA